MTPHPIDTEHECLFPEEQEPSGRLILAPCLACGCTALDGLAWAKDALAAAEHRATRAEAQSAVRGRAVTIYQQRAREAEARIKAVETVIDRADWREAELPDYPVPHGNGRGPALIDTDTIRRALDGDT